MKSIPSHNIRATLRDQRGFTLLELLIVVAILGILAAIVIFGVLGLTGGANLKACQQERSEVQGALDTDASQNNVNGYNPTDGSANSTAQTYPQPKGGSLNGTFEDTPPGNTPGLVALYPNYTHTKNPRWAYEWNASGTVTAVPNPNNGNLPVPNTCNPS